MSSTTYYAAAKMNVFLATVTDGLRDLSNDDLAAFYAWAPPVPRDEATEKFEASEEFRDTKDLPPISAAAFSSQISKGQSKAVFVGFLNDMGIESEYVEDMFSETPDPLPAIAGLEDLIQELVRDGFVIDLEDLQARFQDLVLESETVLHIDDPAPVVWAEEDSLMARKIVGAKSYASLYLKGGTP